MYLIIYILGKGEAIPVIGYNSIEVQVGSGSSGSGSSSLNIHPNGDDSKCVGILGGTYADGTAVDIFDCNDSTTQKWQWNGNALTSVNPADGSQWCLDSGDQSTWTNGLKMKIWQCFSNLPQQTWTPVTTSGTIKLTSANFCLDLTNGDKMNQNILQIWTCTPEDVNQVWSQVPSPPVQVGPGSLNIHPNGDNSKCVGILGGVYANGSAVDIYDCNGSNTQKWGWNGNALTSVNPADGSRWCLDAGVQSTWTNGLKMKIWQCFPTLPQQNWNPIRTSGSIQLTSADFCLDLTNGNKTNQNVLQIWTCAVGNGNQIWTF
ncbi:ricin B lectin domain-containing protein [Gymnopilus junonius]|uniref:Ricin B lectin domain-containing protein n=1 Tax=Gymnopilus junonius TaxID=109634 RepID=A0A9P5TFE6_GYMJU|nr:ricin B lectin domain-containing protein [Gymnopilus junonius]